MQLKQLYNKEFNRFQSMGLRSFVSGQFTLLNDFTSPHFKLQACTHQHVVDSNTCTDIHAHTHTHTHSQAHPPHTHNHTNTHSETIKCSSHVSSFSLFLLKRKSFDYFSFINDATKRQVVKKHGRNWSQLQQNKTK